MAATDPIEIMRPGSFTAVDGSKHVFTPAMLAAGVANYDPVAEPAPLVVGHPKLDAPAYGWAASLAMRDDKIVALPEKLDPAFAECVDAGRFRRISSSWYLPDDPNNPRPGALYLKHIGFLGAAAPAVRGLQPVSFSEAQAEAAVTIDLPEEDSSMPDRTAEFAEREAVLETREASFAEREAAIAAREAEIEIERQAEAAAAAEAARGVIHDGNVAFAEAQIEGGRLAPAGRALVVGLLDALSTSEPVSFGEADGELRPIDALKKLFEGAKPVVEFGELAPDDGQRGGGEKPADIATKAVEFMEAEQAAGRTITVPMAVRHVSKPAG